MVGHPVVGAVRMTSAGGASQVIANGRVGELMQAAPRHTEGMPAGYIHRRFTYQPTVIETKEYEQEDYVIEARPSATGSTGVGL